jgi:hypothetical protein
MIHVLMRKAEEGGVLDFLLKVYTDTAQHGHRKDVRIHSRLKCDPNTKSQNLSGRTQYGNGRNGY